MTITDLNLNDDNLSIFKNIVELAEKVRNSSNVKNICIYMNNNILMDIIPKEYIRKTLNFLAFDYQMLKIRYENKDYIFFGTYKLNTDKAFCIPYPYDNCFLKDEIIRINNKEEDKNDNN